MTNDKFKGNIQNSSNIISVYGMLVRANSVCIQSIAVVPLQAANKTTKSCCDRTDASNRNKYNAYKNKYSNKYNNYEELYFRIL